MTHAHKFNILIRSSHILTAFFILPCAYLLLTFSLFYAYYPDQRYVEAENVRQIPTISLTGGYAPGSIILTIGLHLQAMLLFLLLPLIYARYQHKNKTMDVSLGSTSEESMVDNIDDIMVRDKYFESLADYSKKRGVVMQCLLNCLTSSTRESIDLWNRIGYRVGLCTCLFLFLTGSVPVTQYSFVHGTFAALMFLFAIVLMVIYHLKVCRPFLGYDDADAGHGCCRFCCCCCCCCHHCGDIEGRTNALTATIPEHRFAQSAANISVLDQDNKWGILSRASPSSSSPEPRVDPYRRMKVFQGLAFLFLIAFSFIMFLLAGIVGYTCNSTTCTRFVVDVAPTLEYTTVFAFLLFMESFRTELTDIHLNAI